MCPLEMDLLQEQDLEEGKVGGDDEIIPHSQTSDVNSLSHILRRQDDFDNADNQREMSTVTPPTTYFSKDSVFSPLTASRPSRESVLQRLSEALLRRSLTKIDLSQRGLISSDARLVKMALLQNSQLTSLKLGYNNLGDEGVAILSVGISQHRNLQSLDLGFNNIGDEGCRTLCSAVPDDSHLQTLYMAGNLFGEDGGIAIADLIRRGNSLRKLYLTGNLIGSEGVAAICRAILDVEGRYTVESVSDYYEHSVGDDDSEEKKTSNSTNFNGCSDSVSISSNKSSIEHLYLGGVGMGPAGCVSMAKLVKNSHRLRVLSLPNCDICDESIALLSSSLKANRQNIPLESLQLSFNRITCRGMESLSNAVWGSNTIQELLLDNNQIADRGAQQIATVLPHVRTMETLNIGFNQIKPQGIKMLMRAIVDSKSIKTISIAGNIVDTSAAKAIAYALAYNTSLVSLSVVHCNILHEGQRHVTAGLVSNSKTQLRDFSGFKIGPVVVTLGFPNALEHWTNTQILNFIHMMWQRNLSMFNASKEEEEEKMMDPMNYLSEAATKRAAPLEATIVVDLAKKTLSALVSEGYDVFSRGPEHNEYKESPLASDGIMVEYITLQSNLPDPHNHNCHHNESFSSNEIMSSKKVRSFVAQPEISKPNQSDPSRKKRIVEWLCSNIQHINQCAQTPFSSAELWKLHQHYFTPVVNESGGSVVHSVYESDSSTVTVSTAPCATRTSNVSHGADNGSCCSQDQMSKRPSNSNAISSLPMLKRKVSYRFLGDAATGVSPRMQPNPYSNPHTSVSVMIEGGPTIPSLPPKSKKARRNRSRISFLPRVKAKIDSYLDVCHEKALILMRQLYFVEHAILSGKINPVDNGTTPRTHLCGGNAADAETIVVDMI